MRLFARTFLFNIWNRYGRVTGAATAHWSRLFPLGNAYRFPPHLRTAPTCHFTSGCLLRNDVAHPKMEQPGDEEQINLNLWKSVMRSQAAADDGNRDDKEKAKEGDAACESPACDSVDSSLLVATRELVVMWRQAGKLVPDRITDLEVQTLAELPTKSSKKKYLKYLAIKEGHKKARKEKQEKKRSAKEAILEESFPDHDGSDRVEGESRQRPKNTFLIQYHERSLDRLLAWRVAQAMRFGQPLVFDMSYEQHMTRREVENTVSQLMEVEGWNRRARDPFHLHFCNLQPNSGYKQELLKRYGADVWDRLLFTEMEGHHVDVFPQDQLVYLTADSPNILRTFDPSKVYIVGALVDRSIQSGLSLANAKRLKLATARLPLDQFLRWETGAKNLTLDQMIRILLTIKDTGSWEQALSFVPKRKHDGFYQGKPEGASRGRGVRTNGMRDAGERPSLATGINGGKAFRGVDQGFVKSFKSSNSPGVAGERSTERWAMHRTAGSGTIRPSPKSQMENSKNTDRSRASWWEKE